MPEPIKMGWLGACLDGPGGGYDKIHRLAFDETVESGLLDRPYEFVLHAEKGLLHGTARYATDGFKNLVDEGCIGVAGAYSSRQCDHGCAVGERAAGAVDLVGGHGPAAGRLLLPAR
jgi:branched-chain amino acid transport system substrate-binding protein